MNRQSDIELNREILLRFSGVQFWLKHNVTFGKLLIIPKIHYSKRRKQMKLILKLNLLIAITANPARRLVSPVPNVVLNNLRIIGHVKYVQAA